MGPGRGVRQPQVVDEPRAARTWCRVRVVRADGVVTLEATLRGRGEPDLATVDMIACVALWAHRTAQRIEVDTVIAPLRELLALAALPVEVQR